MAILKAAEAEAEDLIDDVEAVGRKFYKALEDGLDDAGFYRVKGEVFSALEKFGWMEDAEGDEAKETAAKAKAQADAFAKVHAAQSLGVDPNGIYGSTVAATAVKPLPVKPEEGNDLV